MASLDSTITVKLSDEDRQLVRNLISLLETLNEKGHFKELAKEVVSLHDKHGDKKTHTSVFD